MPPRIFYPFLPYRSLFFPFLVVCAIVVPCWLVFRLYRRSTLVQRPSFLHEVLLLTFVVYLSGLASATLTKAETSRSVASAAVGIELHPRLASLACSSRNLPEGSRARGFCVRNAQGNVALFFPLGFLILLVWTRLRFWRGIQIAIVASFSIELLQFVSRAWGSNRTVDVNDVILNVLGASLGLVLVSLLRLRRTRAAVPASP